MSRPFKNFGCSAHHAVSILIKGRGQELIKSPVWLVNYILKNERKPKFTPTIFKREGNIIVYQSTGKFTPTNDKKITAPIKTLKHYQE